MAAFLALSWFATVSEQDAAVDAHGLLPAPAAERLQLVVRRAPERAVGVALREDPAGGRAGATADVGDEMRPAGKR